MVEVLQLTGILIFSDKKTCLLFEKKIPLVAKLVGPHIFQANTNALRILFVNHTTGVEFFTIKSGERTLEEFISNKSVMRRAFNTWHLFKVLESNIYVARGEKTPKVVVRNWTRNHTGDKA